MRPAGFGMAFGIAGDREDRAAHLVLGLVGFPAGRILRGQAVGVEPGHHCARQLGGPVAQIDICEIRPDDGLAVLVPVFGDHVALVVQHIAALAEVVDTEILPAVPSPVAEPAVGAGFVHQAGIGRQADRVIRRVVGAVDPAVPLHRPFGDLDPRDPVRCRGVERVTGAVTHGFQVDVEARVDGSGIIAVLLTRLEVYTIPGKTLGHRPRRGKVTHVLVLLVLGSVAGPTSVEQALGQEAEFPRRPGRAIAPRPHVDPNARIRIRMPVRRQTYHQWRDIAGFHGEPGDRLDGNLGTGGGTRSQERAGRGEEAEVEEVEPRDGDPHEPRRGVDIGLERRRAGQFGIVGFIVLVRLRQPAQEGERVVARPLERAVAAIDVGIGDLGGRGSRAGDRVDAAIQLAGRRQCHAVGKALELAMGHLHPAHVEHQGHEGHHRDQRHDPEHQDGARLVAEKSCGPGQSPGLGPRPASHFTTTVSVAMPRRMVIRARVSTGSGLGSGATSTGTST